MRTMFALALLLSATACRKGDSDYDGDGAIDDDCAPYDAASLPGATELCDGRDNDCDGTVDNGVGSNWYTDDDGDGFGDDASATTSCVAIDGAVTLGGDCDNGDPARHPGATEACSDVDANCDGTAGADDGDDDGFLGCEECDDADGDVFPGADELCNAIDDDCDGDVDDDPTDATVYYADLDDDGFGGDRVTALACELPEGFHEDADDCDDLSDTVNPDAAEGCNGIDDDCDGAPDDGAPQGLIDMFADTDGDGFGDPTTKTQGCVVPAGFVTDDTDCDDTSNAVNPEAVETCSDTTDKNCDGSVGQQDADNDGTPACTDCDDKRADVEPGATEACDGVDNDCNGQTDEAAPTWYADVDHDGEGDARVTTTSCAAPAGFVGAQGDCDDLDPDVNTGATEACNGDDDDCSGAADPNETDADADRWLACDGDCNDAAAGTHPGAVEVCNAADDDCDGTSDDNAADAKTWYTDADADGYGLTSSAVQACTAPSGAVAGGGDCNDTSNAIKPGGTEKCSTTTDDDCDGTVNEADAIDATAWFLDADNDAHGTPNNFTFACTQPSGRVALSDDCNDARNTVYTGATEVWYDGVDQNCDGKNDYDQDGDGALSLSKAGGTDCDDANAALTTCGTTATTALASCAALKANNPAAQNGTYFIAPNGVAAYQVYCDMQSNDGGGWTMILKTAAGSSALQYTGAAWTSNTTTLNPTSLTPTGGTDAKFASYNNLPFREIRGCAANGVVINCMTYTFAQTRPSPFSVFTGPEIHVLPEPNPAVDTVLAQYHRDRFYATFGNPTGIANCLPQEMGFNIDAGDGNFYRWGMANNIPSQPCQELETDDADGVIGWGLDGQDCGETGAGYTNYFHNDNACGGTERSFDSWLYVR